MVDALTGNVPYSYYNVLNPVSAPAPATTGNASPPPAAPPAAATPPATGQLGTSSLSSNLVALLQALDAGSNSESSLLGGGGDSATSNLVSASTYESIIGAAYKDSSAEQIVSQADTPSPLQDILSSYQTAIGAYNALPSQSVQSVVNANSFQADGKTALVV